ncbi:MAG: c-type cytochrome [Chitinophagaceae bacterium]
MVFICHRINEKLVGPAYTSIANLYPINAVIIDSLADRVINGSANHWSTVPMTQHANLPKEDAEKMVQYILSFKKN